MCLLFCFFFLSGDCFLIQGCHKTEGYLDTLAAQTPHPSPEPLTASLCAHPSCPTSAGHISSGIKASNAQIMLLIYFQTLLYFILEHSRLTVL